MSDKKLDLTPIIVNTICFKSIPENYVKEKSGVKNNTLRLVTDETKFIFLKDCTHIKIVNTETQESFTREIRDLTYLDNYVIITWRDINAKREELKSVYHKYLNSSGSPADVLCNLLSYIQIRINELGEGTNE